MIEVLKQALEALEKHYPYEDESGIIKLSLGRYMNGLQYLRQAIAELESQEPVACDGDFPEGFDKSLGIPAQALREANAALCEVTNNRMWDGPALAERMLLFCRNTHPPQRTWQGLTTDEIAVLHANYPNPQGFALALQAKLKEKNGA